VHVRAAVVRDPEVRLSRYWATLHGADLAARVLADVQIEATAEIIDARGSRIDVTLLKGISLAERDYPTPCLRGRAFDRRGSTVALSIG
jgi:hypothetical protein